VVGGVTGGGRSTTCAAIVEHLNSTVQRHIVTVEYPVEYEFERRRCLVDRIDVGCDVTDFAAGLRTAARLDPDVLVVGDVSDSDSAALAVNAAEERLVIVALEGRNLTRILEGFTRLLRERDRESVGDIATVLKAVTCQRLVTRGSGQKPVPVFEILVPSEEARALIRQRELRDLPAVAARETKNPSCSFEEYLKLLIDQGRLEKEEALAAAVEPERLRGLLKSSAAPAFDMSELELVDDKGTCD